MQEKDLIIKNATDGISRTQLEIDDMQLKLAQLKRDIADKTKEQQHYRQILELFNIKRTHAFEDQLVKRDVLKKFIDLVNEFHETRGNFWLKSEFEEWLFKEKSYSGEKSDIKRNLRKAVDKAELICGKVNGELKLSFYGSRRFFNHESLSSNNTPVILEDYEIPPALYLGLTQSERAINRVVWTGVEIRNYRI